MIPTVLDFLQEGVDQGLAINTLRVQVAALYQGLVPDTGCPN